MRYGTLTPASSSFLNVEAALNELLAAGQGASDDATVTTVSDDDDSQTLLAANTSRRGFIIYNDSTAILYVKYGGAASSSDFTFRLVPQAMYESGGLVYRGAIHGIWASDASGSARLTELT